MLFETPLTCDHQSFYSIESHCIGLRLSSISLSITLPTPSLVTVRDIIYHRLRILTIVRSVYIDLCSQPNERR